jgi:hypothetical protein
LWFAKEQPTFAINVPYTAQDYRIVFDLAAGDAGMGRAYSERKVASRLLGCDRSSSIRMVSG